MSSAPHHSSTVNTTSTVPTPSPTTLNIALQHDVEQSVDAQMVVYDEAHHLVGEVTADGNDCIAPVVDDGTTCNVTATNTTATTDTTATTEECTPAPQQE